ncbi:MAG: sugar phosphate isomerase/epimerase family protein [Rubrobacteraceae bacterium]
MSVPIVFSTGSLYPFGLERVYAWAAEVGFDGVEIMMDERWDTHQAEYLIWLANKYELPIRALHPPLGPGAWRLDPRETLVRVAKLATKVGAEVVVAHPPANGSQLEIWARDTLKDARRSGVAVAVENMPRNRVRRLFFSWDTQHGYKPERLVGLGDVTLDTSHLAASGVDLLHAWEVLGDQARHIHFSDSKMTGRDEHRVPGRGNLPLKEFLGRVRRSDYPGVVSLELKPWPLGAPDEKAILDRMREALEYTREGLEG